RRMYRTRILWGGCALGGLLSCPLRRNRWICLSSEQMPLDLFFCASYSLIYSNMSCLYTLLEPVVFCCAGLVGEAGDCRVCIQRRPLRLAPVIYVEISIAALFSESRDIINRPVARYYPDIPSSCKQAKEHAPSLYHGQCEHGTCYTTLLA